ncbi:hypothetical protein MHU86_18017 [Fragilaria crotonensis]|nr:hypothetical protein MHU86_18017 [Fragilaria crotonensis]
MTDIQIIADERCIRAQAETTLTKTNPHSCPQMDCESSLDRPRISGPDTQQMDGISEIRPTDIILGRGPAFYNNPGNMMFRKLLKEHAVHYRYEARLREKTEMITLLVSQLQAKGCRFLHMSSTGVWIEAPSRTLIQKVGHGLRDARLAVAKSGDTVTVIPKNSRPSVTKEIPRDSVTPVSHGEAETSQEISGNTNVITTDTMTPHCHATPNMLQKSFNLLMGSTSVSTVQHMQGGKMSNLVPTPETGQQLVDTYKTSFPTELLGFASQQSPHVGQGASPEKAGLSFFDREIEEVCVPRDGAGHAYSITEPWLDHPSSSFDFVIEGSLEVEHHSEQSEGWQCNMDDLFGLLRVFPSAAAPHDAHVEGDVDVILKMDAGLGRDESSDDCLVQSQSQPVGCAVPDGQSLCRLFRNL